MTTAIRTMTVERGLDPRDFADRKALAAATWAAVADGAATLRQNRPVRPHRTDDLSSGIQPGMAIS